jgi:chromosome partitioning protein
MRIVTIANQKGGVGKTTTAVTLAHGLAILGRAVLLIDLDPQGQAAIALGERSLPGVFQVSMLNLDIRKAIYPVRDNLWILPGDKTTADAQIVWRVQQRPIDQWLKYAMQSSAEVVIFDTSPSVGGFQEQALFAADLVIVPSSCQFLSTDAVSQTMETLSNHQKQYGWNGYLLGILPTFFDERTRESNASLTDLNNFYPDQVLSPIHVATRLAEAAAEGKTIFEIDPDSRIAHEYADLVHKVKR